MKDRVTAAEIESHIVCPRQYEFEHERPISPRESHRDLVRERRRDLLSDAITTGLRVETGERTERVALALERLDVRWESSSASYLIDTQETYDRSAAEAAVETYFSDVGHQHAENVLDVNVTLSHELDQIRYEVPVDAVIEQDGGYLAVRYVPDLSGVLNVGWSDDNVEKYRDGTKYFPRQIASFATAGLAIRSLRSEHGLDAKVDFAYVSLLENSRPGYRNENEVSVSTEARHFQAQYEKEERELAQLLEQKATDVTNSVTDPFRSHFDDIKERSCSYCSYQDACPDYIEAELSFTDRTGTEAMTVTDLNRADHSRDGDAE